MSEHRKSLFSSLVLALFCLLGLSAVVLALRNTPAKVPSENGPPPRLETLKQPIATEDTAGLLWRVSHMVLVPSDATPTVATVQDVDALRKENPAFYSEAQNGDRVIAWPTKIVLYSTSRDIVLVAMPVKSLPMPQDGKTK